MFGQRAIYHDGWRAVCARPGSSYADGAAKGRTLGAELTPALLDELDASGWELFNIAQDPSESRDLAAQERAKLREMIARWYAEAGKYQVLPLDGSLFLRLSAERPQLASARSQYVYYPDLSVVPFGTAPKVFNGRIASPPRSTIPASGALLEHRSEALLAVGPERVRAWQL
jgi:hypothetical protein